VLALGKMGGRELNFGSDLDLVFVYGEDGQSDKGQGNLQFFVELSQMIVNDFESPTSNGRLYGADARLRPEGSSALLALSFDTYSTYLDKRARTWERMALSRARAVAGDASLAARILGRLETFVVGQGLDARHVEEIRDIRKRMELKDLTSLSIKTAPGGIVDVEFLVQILQLRYAKDHPGIRSPSTRKGLKRLAEAGLLNQSDADDLDDGFVFLRNVEKILRRQDERGKTRLPSDPRAVRAIARAVGFDDSSSFEQMLKSKMDSNRALFVQYIDAQA
jgi:glutamate-ammonia-ligase adenylyltransferase